MNIFQHVRRRRNNFRTPSAAEIILFRFQTRLRAKRKKTLEIISKLFQNNVISHVTPAQKALIPADFQQFHRSLHIPVDFLAIPRVADTLCHMPGQSANYSVRANKKKI